MGDAHACARYSWISETAIEPFPDGARHALDRARAHVARDEDARHARLEQVRVAPERPAGRLGVGAGQDEAALVARDDALQPVGARRGADEDEAGVDRLDGLGAARVADVQRAQVVVLALRADRDGARAHVDVRQRGELRDQVVRHRLLERAAGEHRDPARVLAEVHGRLAGRVRSADDDDVLVLAGAGLGHRGAVVDARAGELGEAGAVQLPVGDARRHEDAVRAERRAAGQPHGAPRALHLEGHRVLHGEQLGAEPARLVGRAPREVRAAQAVREAQVVLDPARLAGLAAGRLALDHHGAQPLRRAVHGRRQPGRAAADDHQVVVVGRRLRRHAEALGELEHGRALEHAAVLEQRDGQAVVPDPGDRQQLARLAVALDVEPARRHPVAGEEVAQVVGVLGEAVPHEPHAARLERRAGLPGRQQVLDDRVELLLRRVPRLEQVVVQRDLVDRLDGRRGVGVGGQQDALGARGRAAARRRGSRCPASRACAGRRSAARPGRRARRARAAARAPRRPSRRARSGSARRTPGAGRGPPPPGRRARRRRPRSPGAAGGRRARSPARPGSSPQPCHDGTGAPCPAPVSRPAWTLRRPRSARGCRPARRSLARSRGRSGRWSPGRSSPAPRAR